MNIDCLLGSQATARSGWRSSGQIRTSLLSDFQFGPTSSVWTSPPFPFRPIAFSSRARIWSIDRFNIQRSTLERTPPKLRLSSIVSSSSRFVRSTWIQSTSRIQYKYDFNSFLFPFLSYDIKPLFVVYRPWISAPAQLLIDGRGLSPILQTALGWFT